MFNKETLKKLKDKLPKQDESGNSFLMYLLLMPVLVATMGLGIDVSINTYTQNTLQSALDQATQSTVSLAKNPDATHSNVSLFEEMKQTVRRIYDQNRIGKLANLACQGQDTPWSDEGGVKVVPPSGCGYTELEVNIVSGGAGNRDQYLTASVVEYSKNPFSGMLGFPFQEYHIKSEAVITHANN